MSEMSVPPHLVPKPEVLSTRQISFFQLKNNNLEHILIVQEFCPSNATKSEGEEKLC